MLFEDKYHGKDCPAGNVIHSEKKGFCSMCKRPTNYIEINAEGYFCSEECVDKFYNNYIHASVHMR